MKILQIHNLYRIRGGEDVVVEAEQSLLEEKGHQVIQLVKDNSEIGGFVDRLSLLFRTHYNPASKTEVIKTLKRVKPDVVHVHNFFPLFSPSIFEAFEELRIPCVLSLHNYRLIHPNGLMLHKGRVDDRSLTGSAYNCVLDGVYRSSILQTAVVAHMIEYHRTRQTWSNFVNRFVALSSFAKDIFIKGGIPQEKISVKSNYLPSDLSHPPLPSNQRSGFVYIGRISEEKGLEQLLEYWAKEQTQKLQIIGDGPQLNALKERFKQDQITWHGRLSRAASLELLSSSRALLFPSICFENFPMTIVEAFGRGIPVISNNFGSHGTLVEHGMNGFLYLPDQPTQLSSAVEQLSNDRLLSKVSTNAYKSYQERYTEDVNYDQLMRIYESVL